MSTASAKVAHVPEELRLKMDRVMKRASKFHWDAKLVYSQINDYKIVGSAHFTREYGTKAEEMVSIRFVINPQSKLSTSVRFMNADKLMKRAESFRPVSKFHDFKSAIDYMSANALPKPPRVKPVKEAAPRSNGNNADTNQGDTTTMATSTTTKKKLVIRKAGATKAAPAKAAAKPAAKTNGKTAAADTAQSVVERDAALIKKVGDLRKKDMAFGDIAAELGINVGKARILAMRFEAGPPQTATPAKVKGDRDDSAMSWAAIAAKYGLRKVEAIKLYKEAGGNPKNKPAPAAKKAAAPKDKVATRAAKKEAAAEQAVVATPFFDEDVSKEVLIEKLNGKRIVFKHDAKFGGQLSEPTRIKDGSLKVGQQKNGLMVVQFNDGDKSRTVAVPSITKVMR